MARGRRTLSAILWGTAVTAGVVVAFAATYLLGPAEYVRIPSPDGRYVAVATHRRYLGFIAMMPGSGGDKPGKVTVYRIADQRSMGSAPIVMVWMVSEIRWEPNSAEIPLVATWDLARCSVEVVREH